MSRLLMVCIAAVLLVTGCGAGEDEGEERTALVDYDHDQIATTFMAYFPQNLTMHPGDTVVFRQQWTGEGHSVTLGTAVDEVMEIARPLMAKYPDEEPPEEEFAPFLERYGRLPTMTNEDSNEIRVNQNGAQPCFLDEALPPSDPDTPCTEEQQRQPAFNGRQNYYNSGFIPYEGPQGNEFRVPLSDDIQPGTYSYYCNLHSVFQNGTINVVPEDEPIPSQAEVSRQAFTEIKAAAEPLLRAYEEAERISGETEVFGVTVRKPFAGWIDVTGATEGWVNEFLPNRIEVQSGAPVRWSFVGAHTVSFDVPPYFSEFTVADDGTVEWTREAVGRHGQARRLDNPGPADENAGEGVEEEQHLDAGAWDGSGFLSSGVVGGGSYTVTFTKPGVYPYACLIHPRMVGEVVVR